MTTKRCTWKKHACAMGSESSPPPLGTIWNCSRRPSWLDGHSPLGSRVRPHANLRRTHSHSYSREPCCLMLTRATYLMNFCRWSLVKLRKTLQNRWMLGVSGV